MSRWCCGNRQRSAASGLRRPALTLLELVVVLGILALLSTVAVRSLEPIADQARYEATQRTLNDLRSATAGDHAYRFSSGRPVISGFVADTGGLPSSVDDLLACPVGVATHAAQTFDSDRDTLDDVTLSSGWNGPYLQLGAGQTSIVDGWGRAPAVAIGASSLDFTSLGSDGDSVAPETGYRADLTVSVTAQDCVGDIVFRIFDVDGVSGLRIDPAPTGTDQLGVLFYGVNAAGGTTGAIEEQLLIVASSGTFEVRRSDTLQGMVAARAIQWNDVDSDDVLDVGETIVKKSYVHYPLVNSAGDVRIEMELR
jgi:type II secretory pathway pseudopilin PulG